MNTVFQSTSMLGAHGAPEPREQPRAMVRGLQSSGGTLAALALGWAAVGAPASAGLAAAWPAVAACLGAIALVRMATLVEQRWAAAQGLVDVPTGLYNRDGLARAGEPLLAQARRDGKPVSMIVLDFDDLAEVRGIYGRETTRRVMDHVVRKMRSVAGAQGLAARTGKTQFAVLLPGVQRDKAQAIVQRRLGNPCRIEFDAGDSEIVLVPDIVCERAEAALESVDELYCDIARSIAEARAQEMRYQVYLQRERVRHSRPMSLPPSGPESTH